jgi:hypothetical protein
MAIVPEDCLSTDDKRRMSTASHQDAQFTKASDTLNFQRSTRENFASRTYTSA